jgi:hypothetical protein
MTMGWGRTFLLGDIGNRLDIEDCEREISNLRREISRQRHTKLDLEETVQILQKENDEIKLYLAALVRLLMRKNLLSAMELEQMVNLIDGEDGALDGKMTGEIL